MFVSVSADDLTVYYMHLKVAVIACMNNIHAYA